MLNKRYILSSSDIDRLKADLIACGIKQIKDVTGGYTMLSGERILEPSLIVQTGQETLVKTLAGKHSQESILRIDAQNYAHLIYTQGKIQFVGRFCAVTQDKALKAPGFTFDPASKEYFTCT